MNKRLLDRDPLTGITQWYEYRPVDDTCLIHSVQDVEPIIEFCKGHYNQFDERASWGHPLRPSQETFHHVGVIPAVILDDMPTAMREGIMQGKDLKAWKRWLNDSDNKMFRTRPGRV